MLTSASASFLAATLPNGKTVAASRMGGYPDFAEAGSAPPKLLQTDTTTVPGTTLYVEISLGKGFPKTAGIFIPKHFDCREPFDLLVFLHGWKTSFPGSGKLIDKYWDGKKYPFFALREIVNAAGKNVVLVAPTLGDLAEYGTLATKFDDYVDASLAAIAEHFRQNPTGKGCDPAQGFEVEPRHLLLAGHSAGGWRTYLIASSGGRRAAQVSECWGFDSAYGTKVRIFDKWAAWAKRHPDKKFYHYHVGGEPKSNALKLKELAEEQGLCNVCVVPSTPPDKAERKMADPHFWGMKYHLEERLRQTPCPVAGAKKKAGEAEDWSQYELREDLDWEMAEFEMLLFTNLKWLDLSSFSENSLVDYCLFILKTLAEREATDPYDTRGASRFMTGNSTFSIHGKPTLDLLSDLDLIFQSKRLSAQGLDKVRRSMTVDPNELKEKHLKLQAIRHKHQLVKTKYRLEGGGFATLSSEVLPSFEAWVKEVESLTGQNIAKLLSDAYRPLSNPNKKAGRGGDHLSYHKTGRTVDLDTVSPRYLIRKDPVGEALFFRLYLLHLDKDAVPDGRYVIKFPAGTKASGFYDDSKLRDFNVNWSYVDVTAVAEKQGWTRIKAHKDYETNWNGREWWHYEKRKLQGSNLWLNWYDALLMIYTGDEIVEKIRALLGQLDNKENFRKGLQSRGVPASVLEKIYARHAGEEMPDQSPDIAEDFDLETADADDFFGVDEIWEHIKLQTKAAITWGGKADLAKSLESILLKTHPELAAKAPEKRTQAEKTAYQKAWIEERSALFAIRKTLILNGLIPSLGGAAIPFGFRENSNKRGLLPDENLPLYRPGRFDKALESLFRQGKINITQEELDLFQRISEVETSGFVSTLNTWDDGVVSTGFMQFTLHVGKIQEWIKLDETAFGRFGIELDPVEQYTFTEGKYVNTYDGIKGVPQKRMNELRRNGWAERFYYAALDPNVIVAEVTLAKDYLKRHLQQFKARLKDDATYDTFVKNYYDKDVYVKALFQESFNNNPTKATSAVREAMKYLSDNQLSAFDDFLKKYKEVLIPKYHDQKKRKKADGTYELVFNDDGTPVYEIGLVDKTARGTSVKL